MKTWNKFILFESFVNGRDSTQFQYNRPNMNQQRKLFQWSNASHPHMKNIITFWKTAPNFLKSIKFAFWIFSVRDIPQIYLLLRNFDCNKTLMKNCWIFSSPVSETPEKTLSLKKTPRFWFKKESENFEFQKICIFLVISWYLQISLQQ